MKVRIELNYTGEKTFLNYWDSILGQDVTCQLTKDGLRRTDVPVDVSINWFVKEVRKREEEARDYIDKT